MSERKDIAILGGGPGGYLAALRAIQLKKKVVVFEEDRVGGTCMNYGCIPTKSLLHQTKLYRELKTLRTLTGPVAEVGYDWSAIQAARKTAVDRLVSGIEFLLQRGKVEVVTGHARLKDERRVVVDTAEGARTYEAERVILATGSRSAALPFLRPDGRTVVTSREALEFSAVPGSLMIIGAGAIGL
ncbi:MAG: FAD-dependent oxidoreductase, partial [Candidatus Aminicenantes bacterium]|nr:FAD-dependent oxidoreductase [Candidatus Aminicenantes bacterium]